MQEPNDGATQMAETMSVPQPQSLWDQVGAGVRWARVALHVGSGIVLVMIVGTVLQYHRLASEIHPWFGHVVAVAMVVGAVWLVGRPAYRLLRVPRVVEPPPIPSEPVRLEHLAAETDYLDRYLENCLRNPEIGPTTSEAHAARAGLADLRTRIRNASEDRIDALSKDLSDWTRRWVPRVLSEVDRKADRLIYQESLSVGLATAVSPNGTLDAFVMLWRSVKLVSQLATLYYGRPGPIGMLIVCRDVSFATAVAGNIQNVTDSLGGLVAKSVGGAAGVVAGPAMEGVTNALVLTRIGHLAKNRCRSFRQWDANARRSALLESIQAVRGVAVGLTTEILRQAGVGIGAVASNLAHMGSSAVKSISETAHQAVLSALGRTPHPPSEGTGTPG